MKTKNTPKYWKEIPAEELDEHIAKCNQPRREDEFCAAINYFGSGQHPWADENSLRFFEPSYIAECVAKMRRAREESLLTISERRLLNEVREIEDGIA